MQETPACKGFTLPEVLVVVAIIATLAGVLFPVAISAKKRAQMGTSISNLRQCTLALALYDPDASAQELAPFTGAELALYATPTCDPADYLRTNCSGALGKPLIGSYAYVRGVAGYDTAEGWASGPGSSSDPYTFAAVYYGDRKVYPYSGKDTDPCLQDLSCVMPTRLIRARMDGSVGVRILPLSVAANRGLYFEPFTWENVFLYP